MSHVLDVRARRPISRGTTLSTHDDFPVLLPYTIGLSCPQLIFTLTNIFINIYKLLSDSYVYILTS